MTVQTSFAFGTVRMRQVEARIPTPAGHDLVAAALAQIAMAEHLTVRDMGSLRTVAGSSHWHITRPGPGQGTAEITFSPREGILKASVHSNRQAIWAGPSLERILAAIVEVLDI
jgi:hypothetical protein